MAAPTNFGQLQNQVMAAIWFLDLIGAPENRKKVLDEIKDELAKTQAEKAELEIGRSFKNTLAQIKNDIAQSQGEAERIRAAAAREAEESAAAVKVTSAALAKREAAAKEREAAVAKREAEARAAEEKNQIANGDLTRREEALAERARLNEQAALAIAADRKKLDEALGEFRRKVG